MGTAHFVDEDFDKLPLDDDLQLDLEPEDDEEEVFLTFDLTAYLVPLDWALISAGRGGEAPGEASGYVWVGAIWFGVAGSVRVRSRLCNFCL